MDKLHACHLSKTWFDKSPTAINGYVQVETKFSDALEQCSSDEAQGRHRRSVPDFISFLKKTKSSEHMEHVCQALTNKLGITDDGTKCSEFISCLSDSGFKTLPDCEDVQECLAVLGAENATMPSCSEITKFTKIAIKAVNERRSRQPRSVDAWKNKLLKKTESSENMEHMCHALTKKLGITEENSDCTAFVSCMTESETLPDCDDVQECLLVLGAENSTMPSCSEITHFTKSAIRAIKERRSRHPRSAEDSCLTFDEIVAKLEDEFSTDFCVLKNMGWMDSNDEFIEDMVVADLPEDIAAGLDNWAECTNDLVGQYAKDE
mgnify:CR=1 FL=1